MGGDESADQSGSDSPDGSTDGLAVAFVPGVTLTKWTRIWNERRADVPLTVTQVAESEQVAALRDGRAQLAFVRLPIDTEGLNVIPLYREVAVAVAAKDHAIAALDSLVLADLEGEKLFSKSSAPVMLDQLRQSAGAAPAKPTLWRNPLDAESVGSGDAARDTANVSAADIGAGDFDLVAAGVGILIVPHSIARLQSRKDLVSRPVTDVEPTQIAVAWCADQRSDLVASRIEEFIGIVRGRTARSSRSASGARPEAKAGSESGIKTGARSAARSGSASVDKSKRPSSARGASFAQQRKNAAAHRKRRPR